MAKLATPRLPQRRAPAPSRPWHPHHGEVGLRVVADLVAVFLTVLLTGAALGPRTSASDTAIVLTPFWILVFFAAGLYDPVRVESSAEEARRIWHGVSLATAGTIVGSFWIATPLSRLWLLTLWGSGLCAVAAARAGVRLAVRRWRATGLFRRRAVIVGSGPAAASLAESIARQPGTGVDIVGLVSANGALAGGPPAPGSPERLGDLETLGDLDDLPGLVRTHRIDEVLVSPGVQDEVAARVAQSVGGLPVTVRMALGIDGFFPSRFAIHSLGDHALLAVNPPNLHLYARVTKRALDLLGSAAGLVALAPILLLIALAIKLDSRGPVLYRHPRVGRGGRPLRVLKFRTMVAQGGEDLLARHFQEHPEARAEWEATYKLRNDPRLTRVGRVLRKLSLDELPQLVNVLKGEMSLVGPRPVLPEEIPRFGPFRDQLLQLRPGVTGWWQVNGRNDVSYEERARLELTYVRNWSVALDLLILVKTGLAVLRGEGR